MVCNEYVAGSADDEVAQLWARTTRSASVAMMTKLPKVESVVKLNLRPSCIARPVESNLILNCYNDRCRQIGARRVKKMQNNINIF